MLKCENKGSKSNRFYCNINFVCVEQPSNGKDLFRQCNTTELPETGATWNGYQIKSLKKTTTINILVKCSSSAFIGNFQIKIREKWKKTCCLWT